MNKLLALRICLMSWLALLGLSACAGAAPPENTAPITPTAGYLIPGPVKVVLFAPLAQATVNTPYVDVVGQAAPETVLSLNDELVVVDATERFTVRVPLLEGPNLIQGLASDLEGNETVFELVITYDPEN